MQSHHQRIIINTWLFVVLIRGRFHPVLAAFLERPVRRRASPPALTTSLSRHTSRNYPLWPSSQVSSRVRPKVPCVGDQNFFVAVGMTGEESLPGVASFFCEFRQSVDPGSGFESYSGLLSRIVIAFNRPAAPEARWQ